MQRVSRCISPLMQQHLLAYYSPSANPNYIQITQDTVQPTVQLCTQVVHTRGETMSHKIGYFAKRDQAKEDCSEAHLLHLKIASQLEDYLSDCNLAADGFLLKHVQKNKPGYVSLKLLTSFKKIKALTRDWRVTLAGAQCSKLLQVNEEGTKVRRREPPPKWLLVSPTSKLILAWNLSWEQTEEARAVQSLEEPCLMESLFKMFSVYGNVALLWVLHPGKALPKELQCYAKHHSELGRRLCAVVKFDCLDAARKAYGVLKSEQHKSNGKGLCVVPLGCPGANHFTQEEPGEENDGDPPEDAKPTEKKFDHKNTCLLGSSDDSDDEKSEFPVKGSNNSPRRFQPQKPLEEPPGYTINNFSTTYYGRPIHEFRNKFSWRNGCSGDYSQESYRSPWVQRRKVIASGTHPGPAGWLKKPLVSPRVLRQPHGPDGTRGFHGSRGRGKPLQ